MPPHTPVTVRALLAENDLHPSRALGQHFLTDPNTARRIVRLAELEPGDRVLEIGPGLGSLTVALADAGAHVRALELDRHLVAVLNDTVTRATPAGGTVDVVAGDALTFDVDILDGGPWACVSNLPYNVATPIVIRLLEEAPQVTRLLVMVQREVGERLAAGAGDDAYGAVSVKVAYHATARVVGVVPPTVFVPPPNTARRPRPCSVSCAPGSRTAARCCAARSARSSGIAPKRPLSPPGSHPPIGPRPST